jgi:hypothetical protein
VIIIDEKYVRRLHRRLVTGDRRKAENNAKLAAKTSASSSSAWNFSKFKSADHQPFRSYSLAILSGLSPRQTSPRCSSHPQSNEILVQFDQEKIGSGSKDLATIQQALRQSLPKHQPAAIPKIRSEKQECLEDVLASWWEHGVPGSVSQHYLEENWQAYDLP